jgi:hypothetical protein
MARAFRAVFGALDKFVKLIVEFAGGSFRVFQLTHLRFSL